MKTTIRITQRHIDRGIGGIARGCALAIAMNEQIPTCEAIVVGGSIGAALVPLLPDKESQNIELPDSACLFVKAFDIYKQCGHVAPQLKPFTFEIEVPDELLAAEPTRPVKPPSVPSGNEGQPAALSNQNSELGLRGGAR